MKIAVCVPWRPAPEREQWLSVVRKHYQVHFGDCEFHLVDSDPSKPFNRSQARNLCVRKAKEVGADVVVINDADTLVRSTALREAITMAYSDGQLHYPFETCVVMKGTQAAMFAANVNFPTEGGFASTGGVYVIRPDAWERFGGADESYFGWGGEDDAVMACAKASIGVKRHAGVAVSLGHTAERLVNPFYAQNMLRTFLYETRMEGNPIKFRSELTSMCENFLKNTRVAVVLASRGRPQNVARMLRSIDQTRLCKVEVLLGVDGDDPMLNEYEKVVRNEQKLVTCFKVSPKRQRLNAWWNELALDNLGRYNYMIFVGDDNVFVTPGWDSLLVTVLKRHNDAGFATGQDMLRTDQKFTWAMMSTKQIGAIGYVGPPALVHLCIDTAWQYIAQETGTKYWVEAAVIEHRHYARTDIPVAKDEVYAEANSAERYRLDHEALERWRASPEFKRACEIVSGMIKPAAEPPKATEGFEVPFEISVGGVIIATGRLPIAKDHVLRTLGEMLCK